MVFLGGLSIMTTIITITCFSPPTLASVGLGGVDISAMAARGEALVNTSSGLGGVGRFDPADGGGELAQSFRGKPFVFFQKLSTPNNIYFNSVWNALVVKLFKVRNSFLIHVYVSRRGVNSVPKACDTRRHRFLSSAAYEGLFLWDGK